MSMTNDAPSSNRKQRRMTVHETMADTGLVNRLGEGECCIDGSRCTIVGAQMIGEVKTREFWDHKQLR